MQKKAAFKKALIVTVPVLLGYMAIGIAFGLLLVNAGYPWWLAPVMSTVIYAGAGQYVAVPMFAADAGMYEMISVTFLVNARHIVYGLSLIEKFRGMGLYKFYVIFGLTDETYGLLTTVSHSPDINRKHLYFFITLLDHIYWIAGGVIGAILGALIPYSFEGVEFALSALFMVLLIEQVKACKKVLPFAIALPAAIFSLLAAGKSHMLIVSISISLLLITLLRRQLGYEKSQ